MKNPNHDQPDENEDGEIRIDDLFTGGDGSSIEQAVILKMGLLPPGLRDMVGVRIERDWIARRFPQAEFEGQQLVAHDDGNLYDRILLRLSSGEEKAVYFRVTELFDGSDGPEDLSGESKHPENPCRESELPENLHDESAPPEGGGAEGQPPPRRALGGSWGSVLVLAAFLAVVGAIAWSTRTSFLAQFNPLYLGIMGGLVLLIVWLKVFQALTNSGAARRRWRWVVGLALLLGWGLLLGIWQGFPVSRVIVDNFSDHQVNLLLDGRHWMGLWRNRSREVSIGRGPHKITVLDARTHEVLDRQDVNPQNLGPFVFNVLGAQTYYRGELVYSQLVRLGDRGEDAKPQETARRDVWFLAQVDDLFQHPRASVKIQRREGDLRPGSVRRTYLLRYSFLEHPLMDPQTERLVNRSEESRRQRTKHR